MSLLPSGPRCASTRRVRHCKGTDMQAGTAANRSGGDSMLDSRERLARQIAPGMDVCDVSGEKVGTVARVGDVVEAKTGPFGLGKRLYVPPDDIDGVTEAGVILKRAKY